MAKKSRTPPPPRRVQAPRRRDDVGGGGRNRRVLVIAAVVAALVALGGAALVVALARGGGSDEDALAATLREGGCTLRAFPSEGQTHVPITREVDYDTDPPTSGPHADQWAIWDMYTTPIRQVQGVHNLEHGGILIQYGAEVSDADVEAIGEFYREDPNAMLVAPYPKLGDRIVLTAWTKMATCTRWDADAAAAFRDELRYNGPEKIPPEDLEPGE